MPSGNEVVLGTPVASVTSDQCMDMCSCDSECAMFVWSEYDNCFGPETGAQTTCRMCRIFHYFDSSDPFYDFAGFTLGNDGITSSFVGTINATSLSSPFNNCNDPAACENPETHLATQPLPGMSALEQVEQGLDGLGIAMCVSTIFNDTTPSTNG